MLVFALNLQNVKEVGCRGVHLDEVLVRCGLRVWQLGHLELVRRLEASSVLHVQSMKRDDGNIALLTLTYCDT